MASSNQVRHPDLPALRTFPTLSPNEVAKSLGVERTRAVALVASGALGEAWQSDNAPLRFLVSPEKLMRIEQGDRLELRELPDGILVKVGPADRDADPVGSQREWYGWDAKLSESARADAVRGWWLVREPERYEGNALFVTLSQIVVEVFTITGFTKHDRNHRIRFDVTIDDTAQRLRDEYIGRRVATRRAAPYDPIGGFVVPHHQ